MDNMALWNEICDRLAQIPDYQSGVIVQLPNSLGGEERFYFKGGWWELSFAAMYPETIIRLVLDDIFPSNPDRD